MNNFFWVFKSVTRSSSEFNSVTGKNYFGKVTAKFKYPRSIRLQFFIRLQIVKLLKHQVFMNHRLINYVRSVTISQIIANVILSDFPKQSEAFTRFFFFLYQGFLHIHWRFTGQQGKGVDHLLFHSTTSTHSRTLRHLFATLHVRWLSRIFNLNACVY